MIRASIAIVVSILLLPAAAAEQPQLRYSKPLVLPTLEQEELVAVPLDSDIYEATQDSLSDLRILTDDDVEVSNLLRKVVTTRSTTFHNYWAAKKPAVEPLPNGGLQITLQLEKDDPQPSGLRLNSSLRNFRHHVRIESSVDDQNWQPLVTDGLIFDYSQFMDVRNVELPLPPSDDSSTADKPRHFRITIDDVTQEQESQLLELTRRIAGDQEKERLESISIRRQPFRIDRIDFWQDVVHEHTTGDKRTSYPLSGFQIELDPEHKQSLVYVESRREPLTSIRLDIPDRNFSRSAHVDVERTVRNEQVWRPMGNATLEKLQFGNLDRTKLFIRFPEIRDKKYRVVVDNRDSPPLDIRGATARGSVYEVVFLAKPGENYRLAYGNSTLAAPHYDTAAIASSLAANYQPLAAQLGKQVALAVVTEPSQPLLLRLLSDARFLGIATTLLVILLGFGLFHAVHRLNSLPQE